MLSEFTKEEIEVFYKKIGLNVKNKRVEVGISQLDLALSIGIKSVAFYSNCESYRYGKHFNLEHLYKISKILKINLTDLLR